MMKKKNLSIFFAVPFLFFQACTTDVGYSPSSKYDDVRATYRVDYLPNDLDCKKSLEGLVLFVQAPNRIYVCADGIWVERGIAEGGYGYDLDKLPESYYVNDDDEDYNGGNSSRLDYQTSTMTDSRDGKTYKTVTIGSQTWMAENLAYETIYAFEYDDTYFDDFESGLFYDWKDAVSGGPDYGDVCPNGWHLPSKSEWQTLITSVEGIVLMSSSPKVFGRRKTAPQRALTVWDSRRTLPVTTRVGRITYSSAANWRPSGPATAMMAVKSMPTLS